MQRHLTIKYHSDRAFRVFFLLLSKIFGKCQAPDFKMLEKGIKAPKRQMRLNMNFKDPGLIKAYVSQ